MLQAVEDMLEWSSPYEVHARRDEDAPVLSADLSHAADRLGFEPKRSSLTRGGFIGRNDRFDILYRASLVDTPSRC